MRVLRWETAMVGAVGLAAGAGSGLGAGAAVRNDDVFHSPGGQGARAHTTPAYMVWVLGGWGWRRLRQRVVAFVAAALPWIPVGLQLCAASRTLLMPTAPRICSVLSQRS